MMVGESYLVWIARRIARREQKGSSCVDRKKKGFGMLRELLTDGFGWHVIVGVSAVTK